MKWKLTQKNHLKFAEKNQLKQIIISIKVYKENLERLRKKNQSVEKSVC